LSHKPPHGYENYISDDIEAPPKSPSDRPPKANSSTKSVKGNSKEEVQSVEDVAALTPASSRTNHTPRFSAEEFNMFLRMSEDLLQIPMLHWDKAMRDWAVQNPEHTAKEWEAFFREKVHPFYEVINEYAVWKKIYFGAWEEWNEKNPHAGFKSWFTYYGNNINAKLETLNAPGVDSSIGGLAAEQETLENADAASNKKRPCNEVLEMVAPNVENARANVKRQRAGSQHVFPLKEVAIPPSQHGTPQKPAPIELVIDISDDVSDDGNGSNPDSDLPEDAAEVHEPVAAKRANDTSKVFVLAISEHERKSNHIIAQGEGSTVPCEEPNPQPPLETGGQCNVEYEGNEDLKVTPPEGSWAEHSSSPPPIGKDFPMSPQMTEAKSTQAILEEETQMLNLDLPEIDDDAEAEQQLLSEQSHQSVEPVIDYFVLPKHDAGYESDASNSVPHRRHVGKTGEMTYEQQQGQQEEEDLPEKMDLYGDAGDKEADEDDDHAPQRSLLATFHFLSESGYPTEAIFAAFRCTSTNMSLALRILAAQQDFVKAGEAFHVPTEVAGIWTPEDDDALEGQNANALRVVEKKHGWEGPGGCEGRLAFLTKWRGEENR